MLLPCPPPLPTAASTMPAITPAPPAPPPPGLSNRRSGDGGRSRRRRHNAGGFFQLGLVLFLLWLQVLIPSSVRASSWNEVTYEFLEEQSPNTLVGNITASANLPPGLTYSILPLDRSLQGLFVVGRKSGILRSGRRVDRDRLDVCERKLDCVIVLEVGVRGSGGYAGLVKVSIHLLDLNDNHPKFPNENLELAISETASTGISFVIPTAADPDSGRYGIQSYQFVPKGNGDIFNVQVTNNSDGTFDLHLILKRRLDRENRHSYRMQVVARDGGLPRLSGILNILVTVLDANDNTPTFLNRSYTVHVRENIPLNTTVVSVKAIDQDEGLNGVIVYEFTPETIEEYGNVFVISNTTGDIYLREPLNFEQDNSYRLVVRAHDRGADPIYVHAKVFVHVQDVNDNRPKIKVNALTPTGDVEIPENADPGAFVAHVAVEDGDSGKFGVIRCMLSDNRFDLKKLYETAYRIETKVAFDRELQEHYLLRLRCEDHGDPPLTAMKDIHVTILDRNDYPPIFARPLYSASLAENNTYNMPVLAVNATDRDIGENGRISYSLEGKSSVLFDVNPATGMITANSVLDYEKMHEVQFFVVATDHGEPRHSATATVILNIIDVNDEAPVFSRPEFYFATYENMPVETVIGTVNAIDPDGQPYNRVRYSLDPLRTDVETFAINPKSGDIWIKRILDREHAYVHGLVAVASNPDAKSMRSSVNVSIHVTDVNDNAPFIIYPNHINKTVKVPHLAPVGYAFSRIEAVDADVGENKRLQFNFAKGNEEGLFDIDPNTGVLMTSKKVAKYEQWSFNVIVTVKDHGTPQKTAASEFSILVETSTTPIGSSASRASQNKGLVLNKHHIILIAMSLSTLFLVIILITAIVLVRRKHTPKDGAHKDRSVKFSEIVQNSRDADVTMGMNDVNMGLKTRTSADGSFCEERGPIKEVKFNIANDSIDSEHEVLPPDLCGPGSPTCRDHQPLQDSNNSPKASLVGSREPSPEPPMYTFHKASTLPRYRLIENPSDVCSKPWNLSAKELEVHRLLQMSLKDQFQDSDSTSGCSAEVSNTDSGRGPSEDGDHQQRNHDNKASTTPSGLSSTDHGRVSDQKPDDRPPSYAAIEQDGVGGQKGRGVGGKWGLPASGPPPPPLEGGAHPPGGQHGPYHTGAPQPPPQYHHHHPHHQGPPPPHHQNPYNHHPHHQQNNQQHHPAAGGQNYLNIPRTYQPKGYKVVPHTSQTLSRGPYRDPRGSDPRDCAAPGGGRRSPISGGNAVGTQQQQQQQARPPPFANSSSGTSLSSFQQPPQNAHPHRAAPTGSVIGVGAPPPDARSLTTTFGPGRTDSVLTSSSADPEAQRQCGGGGGASPTPSGHIANSIASNKRLLLQHVAPGLRDSVV